MLTQLVLFGFMNNLASHLARISCQGGEMITQRFGLMKYIPVFHPSGVALRSKSVPDGFVTKDFTNKWNNSVYCRLSKILCGFKDQVRARSSGKKCGLTRSPLIHSYCYESADDRPTCLVRLFVSSMRLTPSGLTRYFVPDKILPLKSRSFMQYAG